MHSFHRLSAVLCLSLSMLCVARATPKEISKYVIGSSQVRLLPRAANGRDYRLLISLPFDYDAAPNKHYPVLYACDGDWSFVLLCGMYGGLFYDKSVPGYILVCIGYGGEKPDVGKLRLYDYLPIPSQSDKDGANTGHAAEFLEVIQKEIIPFVQNEFRVDPSYRVLAGGSAGGLFTLYTMFTKPGLFQGYVAVSPGVDESSGLLPIEKKFAESGKALPVRLFMSGASEDQPDFLKSIQSFDTRLKSRAYSGMAYEWRFVQGQGHGGTGPESFARGIRFVFEPLAGKE